MRHRGLGDPVCTWKSAVSWFGWRPTIRAEVIRGSREGVLPRDRLLICDRDRKWSAAVECFLAAAGVRVIRTPFHRAAA
jgi:hypothetical protein